jgi:hypothetical protein
MAVETDADAKRIVKEEQSEEVKHFSMDLEFLLRKKPEWRTILKTVLFRDGNIVEHGEEAEKKAGG